MIIFFFVVNMQDRVIKVITTDFLLVPKKERRAALFFNINGFFWHFELWVVFTVQYSPHFSLEKLISDLSTYLVVTLFKYT